MLVLYILGLALLAGSAFYAGYAGAAAGRHVQGGAVVVIPLVNDAIHMFDPDAVAAWAENYPGSVATERISNKAIASPPNTVFARISTVSREYFQIAHMNFISGGPWQNDSESAVIFCEYLAWSLFGAMDVAGLVVQINDADYTISGVARGVALAGEQAAAHGFAWMPSRGGAASILYLRPHNHDVLTARFDAEDLLYHLGRRHQNYSITDINSYIYSIVLRGQILLALAAAVFVLAAGRWAYRLFGLAQSKADAAIAAIPAALALAAAALFFNSLDIDLWLPTFAGQGLTGYGRLLFNTGQLAPAPYLPAPLAALQVLNTRAGIAFAAGLFGLVLIAITRFLERE